MTIDVDIRKIAFGAVLCTMVGWQVIQAAELIRDALDYFSVDDEEEED